MKYKNITTTVIFILLGLGVLYAQETIPSTGGGATGSGGSSSYTVGLVVYSTNAGSNGSVAQGVQQPYETYVVTGIYETSINLELSVYPNPTTDFVNIQLQGNFNYQLVAINGDILVAGNATDNEVISLKEFADGVYFVNVKNETATTTIKVVKK